MKIVLLEALWRPDCARDIDGDGLLFMKWLVWGFVGSYDTPNARQDPDVWMQRTREVVVRDATSAERLHAVGAKPEEKVLVEMGFIVGYRRKQPIVTECGEFAVDGVLDRGSKELEDAYWMYLCGEFGIDAYNDDDY